MSKLQNTPDSLDQIKYHTSEVRSQFHEYQTVSSAFIEFLVGLNDPYYQQDYETMRKLLENRSQYIQSATNERKTQLLLEISSSRHSQSSRASTMSSTTARALAKAEATAALKKAQIQKVRSVRESQSALELQKQELALNQRKLEEKARMETLRLEEEAEIAVAKAQAIDEEFNLGGLETINLPNEDPGERTHQYVHSQSVKEYNIDCDRQPDVSNNRENVAHYEKELPTLDPSANIFTPQHPRRPANSAHNPIDPYIQFMARRELISNKLQNNPQNYRTWRESFKTMIRGVDLTPSEELNLIIEHTSDESHKLAQRIRNAYISKPTEGVTVLWQKLAERFGSSSVITQAHLRKLSEFPKIGFRDNKKLQELETYCWSSNVPNQTVNTQDSGS